MENAKLKHAWMEQDQALAGGRGGNTPVPPRVAAGSTPHKPWTLTEEFNKTAKKPQFRATTADTKRQISELRQQMQAAAKRASQQHQSRKQGQAISSKQGIAALRKKMSQPRNTWELTPLGSVSRGYNPNRDRKLVREIKRQQNVLNKSQGKAKTAFNKSTGMSR